LLLTVFGTNPVSQVKVEQVLKQQIEKSPLEISVNSLFVSGTVS